MSQKLSHQPPAVRYEHLLKVLSGERFLQMRGLNNDLPFYICEYKAAEEFEMQRMRRQLANALAGQTVPCLGDRGVKVLEINLYDLSIELLQGREGGEEGVSVWQQILDMEADVDKDNLMELIQNVLDVKGYLIPALADKLAATEFDILFISGVGEVFPFIRSHNVLNNLQSTAKDKPTVMFFPGEYRYSLEQGASLELFGLLHDDKYYRAFNIYETQA